MKVFLGGTVNDSKWRDYVMPRLRIPFFNPVVVEWDEEAYVNELYEREHCSFCLYVITPCMEGFYSLAEVIDDAYKKTDKTIYCYLKEDGNSRFSAQQIAALENLGKIVTQNGAIWKHSLDEVIDFLNSAEQLSILETDAINDVFISYGRRHSLDFAKQFHQQLSDLNYTVWFDMNDIPLGVDFQEQIDKGIENADNFVFLISPHAVKSVYCRKEIELAVKHNKRIIPILHVFPSDCENLIHPEIAKRNWIYFDKQENFEKELERFLSLLNSQKDYVHLHTVILQKALIWDRNKRNSQFLLVGKERESAEEWLKIREFFDSENKIIQAPCEPSNLHAEYICESRKNANNLMTDVFVAYDLDNKLTQQKIVAELTLNGITTWLHTKDIRKGSNFEYSIHQGVEGADVFLFLISRQSLQSQYCRKEFEYACSVNKRIIPILIEPCENFNDFHPHLMQLQYVDFTNLTEKKQFESVTYENVREEVESRKGKSDFERRIDELVSQIQKDKRYYEQHKIVLVQALKWKRQKENVSILLRGYNLENAKAFLKMGESKLHKPTDLHYEFINQSNAKAGTLKCEVFISYSRTDSDFSRQLNEQLQLTGKTTWFDQESIALGTDFQQEIYRGIQQSDNFVFVISPDSVDSQYCTDEVEFAQRYNKRFITVLARKTPVETLHSALAAVQWIDFENADFGKSFTELVRTLDTDREHVTQHTRWLQRAIEWESLHKKNESLLRGDELVLAVEWLKQSKDKQPNPTDLQNEYIKQSQIVQRQDFKRQKKQIYRLRVLLAVASVLLILSILISVFAYYERNKAEKLKAKAEMAEQKTNSILNDKLKSDRNNFARYLKNADNYLLQKQYSDAKSNYELALSIDSSNYSQFSTSSSKDSLRNKITICDLLAKKKIQFNKLMNEGDHLQNNEDTYAQALSCYQKAQNLNIDNELVEPKIKNLSERINMLIIDYKQRSEYLIAAKSFNFARTLLQKSIALGDKDPKINFLLKQCK